MLDLRTWDFKNDGPVALDGLWEFYWNTHLKPTNFSEGLPMREKISIEVPGTWNGQKIDGKKIPGEGYATYRMKIHLPDSSQRLAFKFLDMATAFSVYVDGKKIISTGVPGAIPRTSISGSPLCLPGNVTYPGLPDTGNP